MPVEDYAVHERTKIGSDFRYGCHKRPAYKKFYYATTRRYFADGKFVMVQEKVPHKMTTACQSVDLWDSDTGCKGCNRRGNK